VTPDTLPKLLVHQAERNGDQVAMREKELGIWRELTWADYLERVRAFSLGLRVLGLQPGDTIAIIGDNRPEWVFAEVAAQAAGAASVGLFQDAVAREVQFIVDHADARFVVVEDQEQVDKLLEMVESLPKVEKVIYYDPKGLRSYSRERLLGFPEVQELGRAYDREHPGLFEEGVAAGRGDDLAVLCYTSGTTGSPKGAMLSHANLLAAVRNLVAIDPVDLGDEYVSFLPCAWIVEQVFGVALAISEGMIVNFPEEPETVQQNIREIGPRMMLAAPRIWENLLSTVQVKMQDASRVKRTIYEWAMGIGYAVADRQVAGTAIPPWLGLRHRLADGLVFLPLRDHLGLAELRRAYTGGAALGPDCFRFFRAIGVNLKQVYGQTEISGLSVIHRDGDIDFETVGKPIGETEIRISDLGEITSRSPGLFRGYYKNPEATEKTLQDGWLRSGDAGLFDEKGHLVVIDRMADVMVLADGSKFSPQYIENKLKFSLYVKEAVIIGQDRPYVAALINIDLANVGKWAETHQVAYTTYTDLAQKPRVCELIAEAVRRVNQDLPKVARIARFVLLYKELDADDEELTRTRKVRRAFVERRYGDLIRGLYSDDDVIHVAADIQYQDGRQARIRTDITVCRVEDQAERELEPVG
jgi:long-chain acyl-CoA synthetase